MLKRFGAIVCCVFLFAGSAGCANKYSKTIVDYDQAEIEFEDYIASLKLPAYFGVSGAMEDGASLRFDVTGDGQYDLIRFPTYGSGMPRVSVALYDPVKHTGYLLDSYDFSYSLESCTEDELIIRKYEFADRDNFAYGKLVIEDGELHWIEEMMPDNIEDTGKQNA